MISNILVLGGGSAGFVAAITLKRKQPHLDIRVIRSPEIGIIGVGEGTTPNFGRHFFECLGLPPKDFFEIARPTWKAGIRFLWGERETFPYAFDTAYGTRLDTPFWQAARNDAPLHGAEEIVTFYRENGPSLLAEKIHLSETTSAASKAIWR